MVRPVDGEMPVMAAGATRVNLLAALLTLSPNGDKSCKSYVPAGPARIEAVIWVSESLVKKESTAKIRMRDTGKLVPVMVTV